MSWRAELQDAIRTELVNRAPFLADDGGGFLLATAALATHTAELTAIINREGCNTVIGALHTRLTTSLLRGLSAIGRERLAGSATEGILRDAIVVNDAILELLPAWGNA